MNGKTNDVVYLYSPGLITAATILGAPVAGCILLAHNYRSLGMKSSARQLLLWGILGTAGLLVVAFFLPDKFPHMVLPIGYTMGMREAVKQLHGKEYESHVASGGAKGSAWKAVGIGVGCLCAIMAVLFLVIMIVPAEQ